MIKAKTHLQITSLNLSDKGLVEIPSDVFLCTNLKKLKLSNNQLDKIPLAISKLHKLEVLDLSNNKLLQLHTGIFHLKKLRTLVLSNNQIRSLPKQINNLKQLKTLLLQNNNIESIENFTILPSLEKLNISHNNIKSLNWLKDCLSLKSVWIGSNPIQKFTCQDIKNLKNLKHLFALSAFDNNFKGNPEYLSLTKMKGNVLYSEEYKDIINYSSNTIEDVDIENFTNRMEDKSFSKTKVFVVHGHNDKVQIDVARTLEKLGLSPIILHEQTDGGKTIIEKFEKNAIDAGFAVILLTADDEGKAKRDVVGYKDRARQNVVFEMGYFMAKLGRDRVLLLLDKGVEKPGDLDGIVYTPIDEHNAWKYKLVKEMKAVGYSVSADSL